MARVLSRNSLMPDNLALLYMETERSCQLRFPRAAKSAQSIEIRLVVPVVEIRPKPTIAILGNQDFFTT